MKKTLLKGALFALMMMAMPQAKAQSLTDILNGVATAATKITGTNTISESTLAGTWKYQSPAVEFESTDILKSLGGSAVSSKINSRLATVCTKAGLKKNVAKFTFNSDKTFKYVISSKNTGSGTWALNGSTLTLTYTTYLQQQKNVTATLSYSGSTLEILFNAEKLMTFMNSVGTVASNYSSTLKTINALVGSYDGMKVGLKFKK